MKNTSEFPHLNWTFEGPFTAAYPQSHRPDPEVEAAKSNRLGHSGKIKGQIIRMRQEALAQTQERRMAGLPDIRGKGFLLRVPEGTDVDALAHALGIELVAETENGLMFAASDTIEVEKLDEVLSLFESDSRGGGSAALILDVFHQKDDARKISELLVGPVKNLWPFKDDVVYTFDLGVQTSASSRAVEWSRLPRKRAVQTEEERAKQIADIRREDRIRADCVWMEAADSRYAELQLFVRHYEGVVIDGLKHSAANETRSGIVFPDSIEVRIRMSGKGFRDLVENFKHLFEVSLPPEIKYLPGSPEADGRDGHIIILAPEQTAPRICVVDSGIQEDHLWLAPAVDKATSKCFLPDRAPEDVADHVEPRGHGTRVAGAVLYPREVPKEGEIQPIAWIQNARVLNKDNKLPVDLPPERYLTEVALHFAVERSATKVFNHSVADSMPCPNGRMCSWAAKIDDLSHRHDLLFIQAAGNIEAPEIYNALKDGGTHPDHLLKDSAKVSSPGQSLHALTVGSVSHAVYDGVPHRSFARQIDYPSVFTRTGYSPLWDVVKPEVVEYGGDRLHEIPLSPSMPTNATTAPELLACTMVGEPAISSDDVGTSFAAPKVAHIAAHIQRLFPNASPQLYRALIVQSARWPEWAGSGMDPDAVLRLVGYGIPSLERALHNNPQRVTLITDEAKEIWSKQYHLYQISIPEEIRRAALEARIRIDVTLAYTACPRRTRSRRTAYLESWLDWCSICYDEPIEHFKSRINGAGLRKYSGIPWVIHQNMQHGEVDVSRNNGSVQKDWAIIEANQMPADFAIAVRAHVGWNHKESGGLARYCLAVTFEALDVELPIYTSIENEVQVRAESEVQAQQKVK